MQPPNVGAGCKPVVPNKEYAMWRIIVEDRIVKLCKDTDEGWGEAFEFVFNNIGVEFEIERHA
jgi:hypothetical protein